MFGLLKTSDRFYGASWWCNMLLNWLSNTLFSTPCSPFTQCIWVSLFDWSLYLRIKLQNKPTDKHKQHDDEPLIEMPVGCTLISLHSSHSSKRIKSEHTVNGEKISISSRIMGWQWLATYSTEKIHFILNLSRTFSLEKRVKNHVNRISVSVEKKGLNLLIQRFLIGCCFLLPRIKSLYAK